MTVRDTLFAVLLVTLYLVFLFLSFETRIRTLFGNEDSESVEGAPLEPDECAPAHPWLSLLGTVFFVAIGVNVVKTGMFNLWGTLVYGSSVRVAGVIIVLMGITCSYPNIEFWCRRALKRLKR